MPAAAPFFAAVGSFLASNAIAAVIVKTIIVNVALGALSKALTKKPKYTAPAINVTVRGTIENRRLVFGQRRVGGVIVFYGTSGTNNKYLWYVIVVAGHQCQSITDIWLDERRITNATINAGTGAVGGTWNSKLFVWKKLGAGAQTVETNLDAAFGAWTTNHRLRGCAYIVARLERDETVFPDGAPQSITSLVEGALCYDPRLDSTNGGSGSHRRDDPQTWEYTRNPALHIRWYLSGGSVVNDQATRLVRYGIKDSDSRIDDAYFRAAANVCDEVLSGSVAPPSGSQARYRCDLEVSCGETRRDILEAMLATMAGSITAIRGQWRIYAGAYDTPVHTLTQDDLYGDLRIDDTSDRRDRYNAVAAVYIDASQQWIEQTTPFRTDADYETQDGGERITREIDLRGVTDIYQAERLAEIELRRSRMMRGLQIVGARNLLKVATNETLTFSQADLNWTNRIFRCVQRQFEFAEEAGRVTLSCRREDPAVYADLLTADYEAGTSNTDAFQSDGPDSPTGLTITAFVTFMRFQVTLPAYLQSGAVIEVWEHTSSTPFSSATKISESKSDTFTIARRDTTTRYYWVRVRNPDGSVSGTFPASTGQSGAADLAKSGDIDTGAATEVYVVEDASESLSVISGAFVEITVPSKTVDHKAIVTAMADVWKASSGGANCFIVRLTGPGGTSQGTASQLCAITSMASPGQRVTVQFEYDASAGTARTYSLYYSAAAPGNTGEARNISLQVELIKR